MQNTVRLSIKVIVVLCMIYYKWKTNQVLN